MLRDFGSSVRSRERAGRLARQECELPKMVFFSSGLWVWYFQEQRLLGFNRNDGLNAKNFEARPRLSSLDRRTEL